MAKLTLNSNEYTVETLLDKIRAQHNLKKNESTFSSADIHDWANKRRIPKQYGGEYIKISKLGPLKILTLSEEPFESYDIERVEIVKLQK